MNWDIMYLINGCHRKNGLYNGVEESSNNAIWMKFRFQDKVWLNTFAQWVQMGEVGKAMRLGEKDSNEIYVLVPV